MLYLVPTPIGNLEDITLRALRILREADQILAEDTRTTGRLLAHYEIAASTQSFHTHNEHKVLEKIVERMKSGQKIALVSDAGTPGISDPGFLLVRRCHEENLPLTALPGPTAFVPALVASGLPSDKFFFEGFLPHKKGRKTRLEWLAQFPSTIILYESPHRLLKLLDQLKIHFGPDRLACVCREISKMHEEITRDTLAELYKVYSERPSIKGEITVVI